ncbi:hypothetical protein QQX98_011878 [Neonectria punicea]|uniref:PD-(D/E)XK nuclease-like domain-containing protein n=1 Tax=Neonectria punicea TaxID=979145 RepID=A0ABR1GKW0_9HYPO
MEDPETPTRKRQQTTDPELTPRPQHETSNDPIKAPSLSSSNGSGRSRSTSPLKRQFLELRLDEAGTETKALSVDALEALPNPDAASLLRIMRRVGTCKGILPDDRREDILQSHKIEGSDLEDWDSAFKGSSAFAGLPGRIPSPGEVDLVREWTTDCIEFKHEGAGWNDEVHFRLLEAIFREPGKKKGGGLFSIKTSHADFQPLQMRPIVLSMETKAENQNLDAAELQIGVWHTAQWAFLRSSLLSVKRGASAGRLSTAQEAEQADEALSRLPFIPAVIVQGHRWLFVLSTRQGHKTILWKEWQFGSTSTVVETYQTVAGLRQLAAWAEKVYLPWFQEEVLAVYKPGTA